MLTIAVIIEGNTYQGRYNINSVIHSKDRDIIGMVHPQQSMVLKWLPHQQAGLNLYLAMPNPVTPQN
jgi:hypothetical protein